MKEQLLKEWLESGKSMIDISKETGKSLSTVRYWCKKFYLKSQYSSFSTEAKLKKSSTKRKTYSRKSKEINWEEIQKFYDNNGTYRTVRDTFGISMATIAKAVKQGLLKTRKCMETRKLLGIKGTSHTQETKDKMSKIRSQFLKDNPDKHPWRQHDKFKSQPCESLKKFLKELNVNFIEELQGVVDGRHFSIDIALPDKMIAIEVNGIHHYEPDGSLSPYYQERHDLITSKGWKVYEIFCRKCFNKEKVQEFLDIAVNSPVVQEFNYFNYIPQPKKSRLDDCPNCKEQKWKEAKLCVKCSAISKRKVKRPSKEKLQSLVDSKSLLQISKIYKVSDNTIRKWCKAYEINCKKR